MAETRSNLHEASIILAALPLTTATDNRWWSHCQSLRSPNMSTSSFVRQLKKGQWTCHTHKWLQIQLVESNNFQGGHRIFSICQSHSHCVSSIWHNHFCAIPIDHIYPAWPCLSILLPAICLIWFCLMWSIHCFPNAWSFARLTHV